MASDARGQLPGGRDDTALVERDDTVLVEREGPTRVERDGTALMERDGPTRHRAPEPAEIER